MYLNCFLGSEFNNAITEELFQLTGIKHKPTSLYHPEGNGKQLPQNILNIKIPYRHCQLHFYYDI